MSNRLLSYAMLMLLGVFISSFAQVLLKKASQKQYESVVKEYINVRIITAYAVFISSTILTIFAYRVVPLSMGAILEATGYLYVTFFSVTIFHEKIGKEKIFAIVMIVAGIIVYSCFG